MTWIVLSKIKKEKGTFYWTGGVSKKLPLMSRDKSKAYFFGSEAGAIAKVAALKGNPAFADCYDWKHSKADLT